MSTVNIFRRYEQEENRFTNGLFSILQMSTLDNPRFLASFLRDELGLALDGKVRTFHVLKGIHGTADGELCGENFRIQFETKIASGNLRSDQIRAHLKRLQKNHHERLKRLVLLTPDDSNSRYIKEFLKLDSTRLLHLGWKQVYDSLLKSGRSPPSTAYTELVRQFLEQIKDMVFDQDLAGLILKIHFGADSGVYDDKYLMEMKAGQWKRWHTPRECKSLDGTGRKLMLYDRTRKGITVEVEIAKVKRSKRDRLFPWANIFAPSTLRCFEKPIGLSRIRNIKGFDDFGKHRKDRNAYRNITHEQYRQLKGEWHQEKENAVGMFYEKALR